MLSAHSSYKQFNKPVIIVKMSYPPFYDKIFKMLSHWLAVHIIMLMCMFLKFRHCHGQTSNAIIYLKTWMHSSALTSLTTRSSRNFMMGWLLNQTSRSGWRKDRKQIIKVQEMFLQTGCWNFFSFYVIQLWYF